MSKPNFTGTNSLPAPRAFYTRLSYDLFALSGQAGKAAGNIFNPIIETREVKDFALREGILKGKISNGDQTVLPKPDRIKHCNARSPSVNRVMALDFVADAFDAMAQRFDDAYRERRILKSDTAPSPSPPLDNFIAMKGYNDPLAQFKASQSRFRNRFASFIGSDRAFADSITNEADFIRVYTDYLLNVRAIGYFPSIFIRSRMNSQLNTGLVIEIDDAPYSNDRYKIENFYNATNFQFYKDAAYAYGFQIDKDIPWRLVADINSPQMKVFMKLNGARITSNNFTIFNNFDFIGFRDFDAMFDDYILAYNAFVRANPYRAQLSDIKCSYAQRKTIKREQTNYQKMSAAGIDLWFNAYIDLKNKYSELNFKGPELIKIKKTAIGMANANTLPRITNYIDRKFVSNNHFEGSMNYEATKRSFQKQGLDLSVKDEIRKDTANKILDIY
jgi:hypothetical protein